MHKSLDSIEKMLRRVVEEPFRRAMRRPVTADELAAILYEETINGFHRGKMPSGFEVTMCQEDYERLHAAVVDLPAYLNGELNRFSRKMGLHLPAEFGVTISGSPSLAPSSYHINPLNRAVKGDTTQFYVDKPHDNHSHRALKSVDAFLVLNGKRHIPLQKSTLSVGRNTENDLVLSSARVSRRHAQIRWRFGRFVVYDLTSRAGTMVNGVKIQEMALAPGDVITISDNSLIYGEGGYDKAAESDAKKTATLLMPPQE